MKHSFILILLALLVASALTSCSFLEERGVDPIPAHYKQVPSTDPDAELGWFTPVTVLTAPKDAAPPEIIDVKLRVTEAHVRVQGRGDR